MKLKRYVGVLTFGRPVDFENLGYLDLFESPPIDADYTIIGKADVDVTLFDRDKVIAGQVEALRGQKAREVERHAKDLKEVEEKIQTLLAIGYTPEPQPQEDKCGDADDAHFTEVPDDDIPF